MPPIIDVVLIGNRAGPKNVRTHRVSQLHPDERTTHHDIPITTVPRTLLDLAAVANKCQLRRAVNQAALDSYDYHRTQYELDRDHRRDAQLKMCGYEVLRVSATWLDADPREVAETIRELLRRCALPRA